MAVSRPRLETRYFLLKRKEVPPASHYCPQQVSAPAQRRIPYVFHEVNTLRCAHFTCYCYDSDTRFLWTRMQLRQEMKFIQNISRMEAPERLEMDETSPGSYSVAVFVICDFEPSSSAIKS